MFSPFANKTKKVYVNLPLEMMIMMMIVFAKCFQAGTLSKIFIIAISDTGAGFKPMQNPSSSFVE